MTTDTPRTDEAFPHLIGKTLQELVDKVEECADCGNQDDYANAMSNLSDYYIKEKFKPLEHELTASKAEVERLTGRMKEAEDLIKGLHDGWKKARTSHLETCKNVQAEIDKLHTENVCLQEIIQEFYEWTRRDYPTEQEVREIMNRYHDLLNK